MQQLYMCSASARAVLLQVFAAEACDPLQGHPLVQDCALDVLETGHATRTGCCCAVSLVRGTKLQLLLREKLWFKKRLDELFCSAARISAVLITHPLHPFIQLL